MNNQMQETKYKIKELQLLQALVVHREDIAQVAEDLIELLLTQMQLKKAFEVVEYQQDNKLISLFDATDSFLRIGTSLIAVNKRVGEHDRALEALLTIEPWDA